MNRLKWIALVALVLSSLLVNAQDGDIADAAPRPLKVWLPAPLISDESGDAFQLLSEHTAAFGANNDIAVAYRIKEVGKVGGIMSTIRSGSEVAPAALPDVTLIRRRDFTPKQAVQYLQSMETLFSSSLINDLDNGVEFGQVPVDDDLALYGMPYLFDMLLAVYTQPMQDVGYRLTFADVFDNESVFLFPAARTNGLNHTFYLQYLSAGGLTPRDGVMDINDEVLESVLQFYQDLLQSGLISPDVLTFQTPAEYLAEFINHTEHMQIAIFSASEYLTMIDQQNPNLLAANIPTASGDGVSILDGWLWVIVTPELSRQAVAARFLEWMMEPDFHAGFAKALYHLPAQPAILDESLPDNVDHQFFDELLSDATLPLPESEGAAAPRLMQEALIQVLHGDATASTATRQALSQFAQR